MQTLSLTQKFVIVAPNGMNVAFADPSGAAMLIGFKAYSASTSARDAPRALTSSLCQFQLLALTTV